MDIKTINKLISYQDAFTAIIGEYSVVISRYWRDIEKLPTYEVVVGFSAKQKPHNSFPREIMVNPNWVSIDYNRRADETTSADWFVPECPVRDGEKDAEKVKEYILAFKKSLRQEYCPA